MNRGVGQLAAVQQFDQPLLGRKAEHPLFFTTRPERLCRVDAGDPDPHAVDENGRGCAELLASVAGLFMTVVLAARWHCWARGWIGGEQVQYAIQYALESSLVPRAAKPARYSASVKPALLAAVGLLNGARPVASACRRRLALAPRARRDGHGAAFSSGATDTSLRQRRQDDGQRHCGRDQCSHGLPSIVGEHWTREAEAEVNSERAIGCTRWRRRPRLRRHVSSNCAVRRVGR
jgi:hypothetical protein